MGNGETPELSFCESIMKKPNNDQEIFVTKMQKVFLQMIAFKRKGFTNYVETFPTRLGLQSLFSDGDEKCYTLGTRHANTPTANTHATRRRWCSE